MNDDNRSEPDGKTVLPHGLNFNDLNHSDQTQGERAVQRKKIPAHINPIDGISDRVMGVPSSSPGRDWACRNVFTA